jgi:hypothetical protein
VSLQESSDLTLEDREALQKAVKFLEHPSLAAPAYQPDRQAHRTHRLRAASIRIQGNRICDREGFGSGAEGGVADSSAVLLV